jgi:hypothetical protein
MTKKKPGAKRGRPVTTGTKPRVSVRIPQDWYDTLQAMPGTLTSNLTAVIHAGLFMQIHGEKMHSGKKSRIRPD